MPEQEKSCFIIMPISTPTSYLDKYRDEKKHFEHVLNCLFIPSVEKVGYRAISPKTTGSEIIHAEIIKNLEDSDLVLCDMSCLNPNVFFEFGIRTALNKPVCIVKDELIEKIPFDIGMINIETYQSNLDTWEIEGQINKLVNHIQNSEEKSEGKNTLWKRFGLKTEAQAYEGLSEGDDKLEFIALQMEALNRKIDIIKPSPLKTMSDEKKNTEGILEFISGILPKGTSIVGIKSSLGGFRTVVYSGKLKSTDKSLLKELIWDRFYLDIEFEELKTD